MRQITSHIVEGDSANHQLKIEVTDELGAGGENHRYEVSWYTAGNNGQKLVCHGEEIVFQNGPIKEVGVNGLTNEVLLAIVIDRMESFQKGPFACDEDDWALTNTRKALNSLQRRTRERIARGVEGTHAK